MSISATATHSSVWTHATSALSNAPQPGSAGAAKPNEAGSGKAAGRSLNIAGSSNPFDALSQASQFALIQAQAAQHAEHG